VIAPLVRTRNETLAGIAQHTPYLSSGKVTD
jgi:hypothetical protein